MILDNENENLKVHEWISIEEVIQGREFETLDDTEKEEVITQLSKKWTDPNNEVVKRIGLFKEKSPDILKVILES